MEQYEQLKDWIFRYQYIYRLRRTTKQKQRFLSALIADVTKMRQDIKVMEYRQNKKYISSSLYVGNIETADQIICTYYDTPPQSFGSYYLFDRKKQSKSITDFIIASSAIGLLSGLLLTWIYLEKSNNSFDFSSLSTWVVILCYGLYFYLFSKVTKGVANRKTLIQNTSSVISLLTLIDAVKNEKTAFAFVDEGCFGENGLDIIVNTCKASAKIYYLNCVGANTNLHIQGSSFNQDKLQPFTIHHQSKGQIDYIFGARIAKKEQKTHYYLTKSDLKRKTVKVKNLTKIIELFASST